MQKKFILFISGFLLILNVFCWAKIFDLASNQNLKVVYFDVGQGDSVFIETPELHQILIDGGPGSTVLGKLAEQMPFWDRSLDLIILSHPESDHMQGLLSVLERYKADYILWTGVKKSSAEYDKWINVLARQQEAGAKIIIAEAGQEITAGNLEIDTLYPFLNIEGEEAKSTSNDTCVVSRLIYGKNFFLFTGDISSELEKELVDSGENITSDILKVAHHGSKYSTSLDFLAAASPSIAIIEVGKNSYGHPTSEVLGRLSGFAIQTLRTDQKGDITILSNGNKIYIK